MTHHICVSFVPHRPEAAYNTLLWVDKQRDGAVGESGADRVGGVGVGFTCYVPGRALSDLRPFHAALLVPAGYDMNWTIHYTPSNLPTCPRQA